MKDKTTAIVLAAGQGKRMNTSVAKQFLLLGNKPVIYYCLKAFEESSIDEIILVTGNDMVEYCKQEIVDRYQITKVTKVIEGGRERYDSVYQALLHTEKSGYVLIHDGARPFITLELIERLIQEVKIQKACILGTPVKETVKVVNTDGYITATPNRETLWAAQTPQAFDYSLIRNAYDLFYKAETKYDMGITDDAMVYEVLLNLPVKIIQGDYNNIKLTTPEDIIIAEEIYKSLLFE
jgi:2-C-methyl-D-erythritol 4-phosphate cytidylyltransferase